MWSGCTGLETALATAKWDVLQAYIYRNRSPALDKGKYLFGPLGFVLSPSAVLIPAICFFRPAS